MLVRYVARFKSTLPEDIIETEDGSGFVQPPGKSVADALTDIFRKLDCDVYYGPAPEGDAIWELGVEKGGRSFRAGINLVEDYFFWFENPSWTDNFLGRKPAVYLDLLRGLSRELTADARFSDVRWFANHAEAEYSPGHPIPME